MSSSVSKARYGIDGARAVAEQQRQWCTSRASPVSITKPTLQRVPSRTRWWWTPAVASRLGIGARVALDAAVGQDQDGVAGRDRLARLARRAPPSPARGPAGRPRPGRASDRVVDLKPGWSTWRSFASSSLSRIGRLELDLPARLRHRLEQVALGADASIAIGVTSSSRMRVERRVGHLREELLEVVVEQPRAIREHRERGVGAHRADRLLAGRRPSAPSSRRRSSCV